MFVPLKVLLQRKLSHSPKIKRGLEAIQIKELWQKNSKEFFGEKTAAFLHPFYFNKGVLVVAVPNHIIAQEAKLREEAIKKEINKALKTKILKRVIYKIKQVKVGRGFFK